jgi:hypothetical protein
MLPTRDFFLGAKESSFGVATADEVIKRDFIFVASANDGFWHETDVLCVPTNVCSRWKSGHAADITPLRSAYERSPCGHAY